MSITKLYNEISKNSASLARFFKTQFILVVLSIGLFLFQAGKVLNNAQAMSEDVFYPKNAVLYLNNNLPEGEIFSSYGWGGYLIWKLPEKKVFVDGRMPSWRWKSPSTFESSSAFEESQALLRGEIDFMEVFEKYDVNTVLWPVTRYKEDLSLMDHLTYQLDAILVHYKIEKRTDFDLIEAVGKVGWTEVYRDEVAVIYKKPV